MSASEYKSEDTVMGQPSLQKTEADLASRQKKQAQFASSSLNGGEMTSKLSSYRRHCFLPMRKFDQQLGLFFGPFARL